MTLFRNLLLWIALAVIGAGLAWMLVGGDHGQVLVRYGGYDYAPPWSTRSRSPWPSSWCCGWRGGC